MEEIIKFIERDDLSKSPSAWSPEPFPNPFEINAEDFLEYAESDLQDDSPKSLINSLGNIKKSIENRIDTLLYSFGYSKKIKKEKWNFPRKIKLLQELELMSPKILERINAKRNKLEHSYLRPSKESVEDAFDVASLFIAYTNMFLSKTYEFTDWELENSKPKKWVNVTFNLRNSEFALELFHGSDTRKCTVSFNDQSDYKRVLKQWVYSISNK